MREMAGPQREHMAKEKRRAALPRLEQLRLEEKRERSAQEKTETDRQLIAYRYFAWEKMGKGLHIARETDQEADRLVKAGRYADFQVYIGYAADNPLGERIGEASFTTEKGDYVRLTFDRDRLLFAACSGWKCYMRRDAASYLGYTLCVHQVALLRLLQAYLRDNNPGDATNAAGNMLMRAFPEADGLLAGEGTTTGRRVLLRPYICEQDERLSLLFRLGETRLYKIKDLSDFLFCMEHRRKIRLSPKRELALTEDHLDEEGKGCLELIRQALAEEEYRADYLNPKNDKVYYSDGHGYDYRIKDRIPLYGERLDRFFQLEKGKQVEFQLHDGQEKRLRKAELSLQEKKTDIKMSLSALVDSDGVFQGISLKGEVPLLFEGADHHYLLKEPQFIRLAGGRSRGLPLLKTIARGKQADIHIGRGQLRRFYRSYLPLLKEFCRIEREEGADELISRYLPPEASFVCYLDADGESLICHPQVSYGEKSHDVTDLYDGRGGIEVYRDREREKRVLELLRHYFPGYDDSLRVLFTPQDEEAVFRFLDEGLDRLLEVSEVRGTDRFRRLGVSRRFSLKVGVSIASGLMELDIFSEELSREELLEVLESYRQKLRYVRLKSGNFLKLENNETAERLRELMDSLHLSPKEFVRGKMHIPVYRALYLDRMLEEAEDIYAQRDKKFKTLVKRFKTVSDSDFEVPAGLSLPLRKYQAVGYRWLRTLDENGFGGILADEMGLGKTLQVISVLLAVKEEGEKEAVSLVVCPASLIYNWGEELRRFAPSLKVVLLTGAQDDRRRLIDRYQEADVLVTSYDLLKRDADAFEGKQFRFEIIDEAQWIKNHATAAAKTVKLIQAKTKFALTGTPIENRLSELWSIFDYLMPDFLYSYPVFRREIELPVVRGENQEASRRLGRMVSPFILRRLKKDVLKDLPEKLEQVRYAGMEGTQRQLYDAQAAKLKQRLTLASEEDFRKQRFQILTELTKLRQICCDPGLCFQDYQGESAKRSSCLELIRGAIEGGHRMLIFSQFTSMLQLLETDLRVEGIAFYQITGETPKQRRQDLVNAFNEGDVPVFLISLKAGGTGLNLIGADTVIQYDPWWNLAVQNQAADRAHRIGQTKVVTVYQLVLKGTVEEKILQMQSAKKKLAEEILGSEEVGRAAISREELLELFAEENSVGTNGEEK